MKTIGNGNAPRKVKERSISMKRLIARGEGKRERSVEEEEEEKKENILVERCVVYKKRKGEECL